MFKKKIERSREQMEEAIKTSKTYREILKKLGHKNTSSNELAGLERDIIKFKINVEHIQKRNRRPKLYTEEKLKQLVQESHTLIELLNKIGTTKGTQVTVFMDIVRWNIDISHFIGREHISSIDIFPYKNAPIKKIFSNEVKLKSHQLKLRLIKEGFKKPECEHCFNTEYLEQPIPLELNHIDGNKYNNIKENLELLCPNCHSQTWTFAGKNKMLKFSDASIIEAITNNATIYTALIQLGGKRATKPSYYRKIREDIKRLGINTDHMHFGKAPNTKTYNQSLDEIMIENSSYKTESLKKRLFNENLIKRQCHICKTTNWNGKYLAFSLDHINGIKNDHRVENVRILCFICHARTPNYKGKNIKPENKRRAKTAK